MPNLFKKLLNRLSSNTGNLSYLKLLLHTINIYERLFSKLSQSFVFLLTFLGGMGADKFEKMSKK